MNLFEIIFIDFLLRYPGAFIRWLFFKIIGKPKRLQDILENDEKDLKNGALSLVFLVSLVLVIKFLLSIQEA